MSDQPPHIVDTTLRDGSYEIDFQFSAADTALIAGTLDGVVLAGAGSTPSAVVDRLRRKNISVVRPPFGPAVAAEVSLLVAMRELADGPRAPVAHEQLTVVGPSVARGSTDVQVDDATFPSQVIDPGERSASAVSLQLASIRAAYLLRGKGSL